MSPLASAGLTIAFIGAVIGLVVSFVRTGLLEWAVFKPDSDGKTGKLDWSLALVSLVLGIGLSLAAMLDLPLVLGILGEASPQFRQLLSGVIVGLGGTAFALGLIKAGGAGVQFAQAKAENAKEEVKVTKAQAVPRFRE